MTDTTGTIALNVQGLNKHFKNFSLKDVSFQVPAGAVVGMIGENGSGKSTCIRCILGMDLPESGTVDIYGQNALDNIETHRKIAASFDWCPYPESLNPKQISAILNDIYEQWDAVMFFDLLKRFNVPADRNLKSMSRGMKVKTCLCAALCHHADLLFLDEATSGLDPVVREEILDLLLEFMEEENRAIFLTSHISSDIERIADYILFIQDGSIRFTIEKTALENYGIARLNSSQKEFIDPKLILFRRSQPTSSEFLISDRRAFKKRYPDYVIDQASLDDVILIAAKGEKA